jgi:hypothetical protein
VGGSAPRAPEDSVRPRRLVDASGRPLNFTVMRPGQLNINALELAILQHMAVANPSLALLIPKLHVLSREFTGVGSYTNFRHPNDSPDTPDGRVSLDGLITVPGVRNGLGSILFLKNGLPLCLEIYSHGEDLWDGLYDGFAFVPAA